MSNAKHQLINFDQNSNFDNLTDPVTKTPFSLGEKVVVCHDKNSLISTRSLDANEHLCPFCNKILDSNLIIVGSAKKNTGKKTTTPYSPPVQPNQGRSNVSPLVWVGLAIGAFACLIFAVTGVFGVFSSSSSRGSESVYYEQPASPRSTNTPHNIALPAPTKTPTPRSTARPVPTRTQAPQNLGYADVSGEIYFAALRKSPGYVGKDDQIDVIAEVPSGSQVTLLDGPEKADGINWWYVEWRGYKGWMAERTGSGKTILIFR